jgi:hypothetical protein
LSFAPIPYSDPDIISPGRGAEQWDNGNERSTTPLQIVTNSHSMSTTRFAWTKLEGEFTGSYNWTHFDNIMQEAIDHRQKLSFGIMPVYDGNGTVVYDGATAGLSFILAQTLCNRAR